MKLRAVALMSAVSLIFLCGCSVKADTILPITSNFTADVQIEYEDVTCLGNIEFVGTNDFTVNITSPESLNGLTVDFNTGETNVSYKGLNCTGIYDFSAVSMLEEALTELELNEKIDYKDGKFVCDKFTLQTDDKGFIKSIEFNEISLKIFLSNHAVIS